MTKRSHLDPQNLDNVPQPGNHLTEVTAEPQHCTGPIKKLANYYTESHFVTALSISVCQQPEYKLKKICTMDI